MLSAREMIFREAHAIALLAKCGSIDSARARQLFLACNTALDWMDRLNRAVTRFYVGFLLHEQSDVLGAELEREILRDLRPDPVDAGRIDIHG